MRWPTPKKKRGGLLTGRRAVTSSSQEAPAPPASTVRVVDAPAAGIAPNELGTVVAVEQPEEEL